MHNHAWRQERSWIIVWYYHVVGGVNMRVQYKRLADMALHKTVLTEHSNHHCIRLSKHFCPPLVRRIMLSIRRLDRGKALIQKFSLSLVHHYVCFGETRRADQKFSLSIFFQDEVFCCIWLRWYFYIILLTCTWFIIYIYIFILMTSSLWCGRFYTSYINLSTSDEVYIFI